MKTIESIAHKIIIKIIVVATTRLIENLSSKLKSGIQRYDNTQAKVSGVSADFKPIIATNSNKKAKTI